MKNGKLASIVLWSVISAAFLGPGTITTAVLAGSTFKLDLLWAVSFATIACIVVQEMAARITISTGMSLGQTFRVKFGDRWGRFLQFTIGWTVIAGCAAFEAGNLVGAVEGLNFVTSTDTRYLMIVISLIAALLLWLERPYWVSGLMMVLVVIMAIAFVILAFSARYSVDHVLGSLVKPSFPNGSMILILGILGTTIVPYNIFLGSGISSQQSIPLMRIGLIVSIFLGGVITAFILIAGTMVHDFSTFEGLATSFKNEIGSTGVFALSAGLFGAGFSSLITAPYAASVIASTVFGWTKWKIVMVWSIVILSGLISGVSGFRPISLIVTVQALNGIILPFLVLLLIVIANDKNILPPRYRPGLLYNVLLIVIFAVVTAISGYQIYNVWLKLV